MPRLIYSFLLLALLFAIPKTRALAVSFSSHAMENDERYYLPPPTWLRVFSLGYNECAAMFLWTKTLVYVGGRSLTRQQLKKLGTQTQPEELQAFTVNYLNAVTTLDPRFRSGYVNGHTPVLFSKETIERETVEAAIDLVAKGLRYFPADGELAFTMGFLLYFEMQPFFRTDDGGKEAREFREQGAHWFKKATLMPNSPEYVGTLSSTLLKKGGMQELALEHIQAMLIKETDPVRRRTLELHYLEIAGDLAKDDIEKAKELIARWEERMPYAPLEMYLLLFERNLQQEIDVDPLSQSQELLMSAIDETLEDDHRE